MILGLSQDPPKHHKENAEWNREKTWVIDTVTVNKFRRDTFVIQQRMNMILLDSLIKEQKRK